MGRYLLKLKVFSMAMLGVYKVGPEAIVVKEIFPAGQ
jgi:hypothetical protein